MEDITNYLDMGGHAAFVWPALGVATLVIVVMTITSLRALRASKIALSAAEAQAPLRRSRTTPVGTDG
ncbi:MAG: heme exporter protein CcmD [Alphaproteobacteria bacterium]|nr:heme exporter protein CcmD [Alphaproteobacteria bacterium]